MATEDVHRFLIQRLANLPQADLIALLDTEGKLVNGSRFWPGPIVDFSYRDYFSYLREHEEPGLFVSSPGRSQFKGNWLFFLARRVNGPSGGFLRIVGGASEG